MQNNTQIDNPIKPLKIAGLTFPNNLIQAPLAGVSSAPFRLMCWKLSHPAFTCTEMTDCKALIVCSKERQHHFISKLPEEGPISFQLVGNDPQDFALATKIVTDYGADIVDLNCGCSVKKVIRKNKGSRLLQDPPLLYKIITAMKQNTHLPVTVKIRVDGNSNDNLNSEIAKVITEAGADMLAVHGRNWRESYGTPCHYDDIKFFADTMQIPVIGNGDIRDLASLKKMFATGCAGAMIGRAGIGNPWLIGKLIKEMRGEKYLEPTPSEIGAVFLEQIELLTNFLHSERSAVLQARLLAHNYARGLKQRKDIYAAINVCTSLKKLREICNRYFVD